MSHDLSWSIPVMRTGYAGRGLVYAVVAGFSLYAIWHGGQAQGTSSALKNLETTALGGLALALIVLGMVAYAVWRFVDSFYDLEAYGSGGKGAIARTGMIVTGLTHLAIGVAAFSLLVSSGGGEGGSSITKAVDAVMGWPGGRWIVMAAGLVVIAAGIYYIHKGWKEKYRQHLRANHFTTNWNWLLKAGLIAQGVVIGIIGLLLLYAGLQHDPQQAGGVGEAFSWLTGQPYGQVLVAIICVGLLGFAVFCFVNAAYRIIPRVAGDDVETLAARLEAKARRAA